MHLEREKQPAKTNTTIAINLGTLKETVFSLTEEKIKTLNNLRKKSYREEKDNIKTAIKDKVIYQIKLNRL